MTEFSTASETISDAEIRDLIATKFAGHGGGARLARAVGVAESTASVLRSGHGDLEKVAAFFGFVAIPDAPGHWVKSTKKVSPATVGRRRWTSAVLVTITVRMAKGVAVSAIARALGVTPRRLRDVIRRYKLRAESEPDDAAYESAAQAFAAQGDLEGARRIRAEAAARHRGGNIFSHMSGQLMSPQAHADIKRAIAAADAAEVSK